MEKLPSITVVIPVYNRAEDLAICLEGLSKQSYAGQIEVIIVDDASNEDELRHLSEQFRTTYIRLETHRGSGYAKNIGLLKATGDYVLFLDSDVEFLTHHTLSVMSKTLRDYPQCGQVGGESILDSTNNIKYVFGRNLNLNDGSSRSDYISIDQFTDSTSDVYYFDYVPTSNCMIRRQQGIELRGFDDQFLSVGEDKDFGYRLNLMGLRAGVLMNSVVLHKFSTSDRKTSMLAKTYKTQLRFCLKHFGFFKMSIVCILSASELIRKLFVLKDSKEEVDPLITEFERHYVEELLGITAKNGLSHRFNILKSLIVLFLAYFWNIARVRTVGFLGSANTSLSNALD